MLFASFSFTRQLEGIDVLASVGGIGKFYSTTVAHHYACARQAHCFAVQATCLFKQFTLRCSS